MSAVVCLQGEDRGALSPTGRLSFIHFPCCIFSLLSLADDTFLFFIQPISHLLTLVQGAALPVAQLG